MKIDRLIVYWVHVVHSSIKEKVLPTGGEIEVTDYVRKIFEQSFLGYERKGPRKQPFHFNFGGTIRSNSMRDQIIKLLEDPNKNIQEECLKLATDLQNKIDERIGDLLLAIGLGWTADAKRCVLWVFPSDRPIQLDSNAGKPTITEIEHAFTRKSKYRKAIYFEGPINVTRNDFLRGELIDSTRQGASRSVAQYWVEKFLHGQIALSSANGIKCLIRGIRKAQKAAKTAEEKSSVISAYTSLTSGSIKTTTLTQFSNSLIGEARKAYLSTIPHSIEKDAVFDVEFDELKKKIKKIVYGLRNGISIVFPYEESIDPKDYIEYTDEGRVIKVTGIIDNEWIE